MLFFFLKKKHLSCSNGRETFAFLHVCLFIVCCGFYKISASSIVEDKRWEIVNSVKNWLAGFKLYSSCLFSLGKGTL